jgi:hypothetical protein
LCRGAAAHGADPLFKKAGWRGANVVAHWPGDLDEPWLLITDLPATRERCRQDRKRMRIELSFRDEKSRGFHWDQSRIRDPQHASRLLLVMALAIRQLIRLGQTLIRGGQRTSLERRGRRIFSVFQLGLRYVRDCCHNPRSPPQTKSVGN